MEITKNEYLQIVALSKLARDTDKEVQEMVGIIGEMIMSYGMASDHIYGYPNQTVDELLEKMDITVEDDSTTD